MGQVTPKKYLKKKKSLRAPMFRRQNCVFKIKSLSDNLANPPGSSPKTRPGQRPARGPHAVRKAP
jgi:hypothetical protein